MVPKHEIADKVEMRNLWVLIELAAINCFQSRQRIGSSHTLIVILFSYKYARTREKK